MPALSTRCRSRVGTLTLPYVATFDGTQKSYKGRTNCGGCFTTYPIGSASDLSAINSSGTITIPNYQGLGLPLIIDWVITFTPTDNLNGTYTYQLTTFSAVARAPYTITDPILSTLGANPALYPRFDLLKLGDSDLLLYCQQGQTWQRIWFKEAHFGGGAVYTTDPAGPFGSLVARAPGFVFCPNPLTTISPHGYLERIYALTSGTPNNDVMRAYAAYDFPADCTSTYCWPVSLPAGTCPFRIVEWQAIASDLTVGATYRVRHNFEWRPLTGGAWSTAGMSSLAIQFIAGDTIENLPWVAVQASNIESVKGGSLANEFRLSGLPVFF